ncbi:MAG: SUMF1/EgtB/PvdO family nonheme iron enzyme [Magnetococcales bacterium]|nr:SUMF1/EgtB/PvdO family nonheme iron enzyme [Magnetococcales bacterium]
MLKRGDRKSGTVPMARVKPKGGERASLASRLFGGSELKKNILIGVIFFGAMGAGWGIMSLMQTPESQVTWGSCLVERPDGTLYPAMEKIPAGLYQLPSSLIGQRGEETITSKIDSPFLIQNEEVSLQEFKKYVRYVENLPPGVEQERLRLRLGVQWNKGGNDGLSVSAVSWEGARDYAHWLGRKTGCAYEIPSQAEWIATVSYLQKRDQIRIDGTIPPTGPLKNLLWGVREWSRTSCPSGYFLLGRDDLTANNGDGQAVCMPPMFSIAGFRVVMNPVSTQSVILGGKVE